MMKEIFKDIKGYKGFYQVSNFGRIKSMSRVINRKKFGNIKLDEKILNPYKGKVGYYVIDLMNTGIRKVVSIHRLVAIAFIPNPDKKRTVNHIDANKLNNLVTNLEWATDLENIRHAVKLGINAKGEQLPQHKLKEKDVLYIRKAYKENIYNQTQLSKIYNISDSAISMIVNYKRWKHVS